MRNEINRSFRALIFVILIGLSVFGCDSSRTKSSDHKDSEKKEPENEEIVRLNAEERREFGIEVAQAGPGVLQISISLPGEIESNADRLAHIVSRLPGVVREVRKTLGDQVRIGEVMAVVESKDLADMGSLYLAARERVKLAEANFNREEDLWKKKISSEQEYLQAKQALAEANIDMRTAIQKLHAVGFSEEYIEHLPERASTALTRYEITAPFEGTVIEKHVALGEVIQDDTEIFTIADLSTVWVNLSVYQENFPYVRKGQSVTISAGHGILDAEGQISYIGPLIGEKTRTAQARVVLNNASGVWRPGLFVTTRVITERIEVPIALPKTALQNVEGKQSVFVETAKGFEPRAVTLGRSDEKQVEVVSGLSRGERYVSSGAFTLKAQLSKGELGEGHGH